MAIDYGAIMDFGPSFRHEALHGIIRRGEKQGTVFVSERILDYIGKQEKNLVRSPIMKAVAKRTDLKK